MCQVSMVTTVPLKVILEPCGTPYLENTDVKSNEVRFQLDLKADYTECEEHYKRRERHRLKDGLEERIAQRKIKP